MATFILICSFSGTLAVQAGQFYDGTLTAISFSAARVSLLKQFSLEPTISINHVRTPAADRPALRACESGARPQEPRVGRQDQPAAAFLKESMA